MNHAEQALLAALTDIPGIGDARAYDLYTHFEDPFNLLSAPDSITDKYHFLNADSLAEIRSLDERIDTYRHRFEGYATDGIEILGIEDARYPESIRNGPAPVLLYAKGNLDLLTEPAIGVSGSRETNEAGQQWIKALAAELAVDEYTIISGGARGADTAAHTGALETPNSTIAVLGTGVNVAYPPENQSLFDEIVATGGLLLSRRPPDADPTRHSFINRNELIAALSDAMIFVATDGSGGTMAQYEMAVDQDYPVLVPPPDSEIEPSEGLEVIRQSEKTVIIETLEDVQESLPSSNSRQMDLDDWT